MNSIYTYLYSFRVPDDSFLAFLIAASVSLLLLLYYVYKDVTRSGLKNLAFEYSSAKEFEAPDQIKKEALEDWEEKIEEDFDYSLVPSPEYLYFLKDPKDRWIHFRDEEERAAYLQQYYKAKKPGDFFTSESELLAGKLTHFYFKSGFKD